MHPSCLLSKDVNTLISFPPQSLLASSVHVRSPTPYLSFTPPRYYTCRNILSSWRKRRVSQVHILTFVTCHALKPRSLQCEVYPSPFTSVLASSLLALSPAICFLNYGALSLQAFALRPITFSAYA